MLGAAEAAFVRQDFQRHISALEAIPRGVEALPTKLGSPGVPSAGFNLTLRNELTGEPCPPGEKGVLTLGYPLPPGCMSTVWGDDKRFVSTYWSSIPNQQAYSTFDMPKMYALLIVLFVLAIGANALIGRLSRTDLRRSPS